MKKFLFIGAMILFTMQTFAQEWSSTLHKADELRGTKEYVSLRMKMKKRIHSSSGLIIRVILESFAMEVSLITIRITPLWLHSDIMMRMGSSKRNRR